VVAASRPDWVRNRADEKAMAKGCRFNVLAGAFVVWWIERHCNLYEGSRWAGEPLRIQGCNECKTAWRIHDQWNDAAKADAIKRAAQHESCYRAGHFIDWQYECLMRLFGWQKYSEHWGQWVRRFNKASIWVPKKNKKSPTLAAIGLYLLLGDGETGQKVFFCAKDGTQAREIAGKHAIEMLKQSDELMEACTINLSLMQITDESTRSLMKPLSSSDSRSQKSKEGLNGCILVDETHVVDDEFMGRVSRAGISRMEPMQLEVSTAGNDPDCYGKRRFDHGMLVNEGQIEDESFFFAAYCAPQDITDDDLDANLDKYGRMANPAWGHTINPEEFRADYNESKNSMLELARFKMYRLNVWQRTANPWLRADQWIKCGSHYSEDSLRGRLCGMGLDLSLVHDMSAMVLVVEGDKPGHLNLLPYFWMPEDEAKKKSHLAPFLDWAREGYLYLCKGGTIDQEDIFEEATRLADIFRIRRVCFDKTYAEELTKRMDEELGIERFVFQQSMMSFARPTADFERMIIDGKIHHNEHPVLSWQASHVQVKTDNNNNKRPVKPPSHDHKKVDGIVAAIMGLAAFGTTENDSVYNERGVILL